MNVPAFLFPDVPAHMPLAKRLRFHSANDVIGQQHLLRPGKPLHVTFASGEPRSTILWGPFGVGKTASVQLIANASGAGSIALSAVLSGVKDVCEAVERAERSRVHGHRIPVFVDGVHRFSKSQRDAFLPHTESGLFTFTGTTTENLSFKVNSALFSRATMYALESLSDGELKQPTECICQELGGLKWIPAALDATVAPADGDGRKLLDSIEIVVRAARAQTDDDTAPVADEALLASALSENLRRFDKGGDAFYDQISVLHRSVRGSDPNGAPYWFCRMLDGGADPHYSACRIARMTWEDIDLANPHAGRIMLDATETYERLGSLEGEPALVQTAIYLVIAPKSNAGYNTYNTTRAFVSQNKSRSVPVHLRNAPTKLMKELGCDHAYHYAHDEPETYVAGETYFPDDLPAQSRHVSTPRGLEDGTGEKLRYLRELDTQWHAEQGRSSRNK